MKQRKRIRSIALLIAVLLIVSMFPLSAMAADPGSGGSTGTQFPIAISWPNGGGCYVENGKATVPKDMPIRMVVQGTSAGHDITWTTSDPLVDALKQKASGNTWNYTAKSSTARITCTVTDPSTTPVREVAKMVFQLETEEGPFIIKFTGATDRYLEDGSAVAAVDALFELVVNKDKFTAYDENNTTLKYTWTTTPADFLGPGTQGGDGEKMSWTNITELGSGKVSCKVEAVTPATATDPEKTVVVFDHSLNVAVRGIVELSGESAPQDLLIPNTGAEVTATVSASLKNPSFHWQSRKLVEGSGAVQDRWTEWTDVPGIQLTETKFNPKSPDGSAGTFEFRCKVQQGSGSSSPIIDIRPLNQQYRFYSAELDISPEGSIGLGVTATLTAKVLPQGKTYDYEWEITTPNKDNSKAQGGSVNYQPQVEGAYTYKCTIIVNGIRIGTVPGTFTAGMDVGDLTVSPTNGVAAGSDDKLKITANVDPPGAVTYTWSYRVGTSGPFRPVEGVDAGKDVREIEPQTPKTPEVRQYQCLVKYKYAAGTEKTLGPVTVYYYKLGIQGKAFGQDNFLEDYNRDTMQVLTGQSLELRAVNGTGESALEFPNDAIYTWYEGFKEIKANNEPNYETTDGAKTLKIGQVDRKTEYTCEIRDAASFATVLGTKKVTVETVDAYPVSYFGANYSPGAPKGGQLDLKLSKDKTNGQPLSAAPAGFKTFEWKVCADQGAAVGSYTSTLGDAEKPSSNMTGTAHSNEVGSLYYRCFITTDKDGVLVTDPLEVTFYELLITQVSESGMYGVGDTIKLSAKLNPEPAKGSENFTYAWTVTGAETGATKSSTDENMVVSPPSKADRYTAICEAKATKAGWTLKNDPTTDLNSTFTLYDGTATWAKKIETAVEEGAPEDRFLLSNKSKVDLTATVEPASAVANGDVYVQWKYLRTDLTGSDAQTEPIECTTDTSSQQLLYTDTRGSAGIYHYSFEIKDRRTNQVLTVIDAAPTDAVWYGIDMGVIADFYEYGKPVRLTGKAIPTPAALQQPQYKYDWYDVTTLPAPQQPLETGNGVYVIPVPDDTGASVFDVEGLQPGEYVFLCVTKDKDGNEISGEARIRVYYDLTVEVLTPEEERLAGRELILRANVSPDRDIDYRWTKIFGSAGEQPTVTTPSQTRTIDKADRGEQEYECEMVLRGTDTRVGIGTTGKFKTGYRVSVAVTPGVGLDGIAGVGQEIKLTVNELPREEQPVRPTYQWQVRDNTTGEWITDQRNDVRTLLPEDTTKREYRCLMGANGDYPQDEQDAAAYSPTVTVTGYKVEVSNSKADETIMAGAPAELIATIKELAPSGTTTYQWEEYGPTGWVACTTQGSNNPRFQAIPATGGIHEYRCMVTLPGGAIVESEKAEVKAKQSQYTVTITTDPAGTTFPLNRAFSLVASINKNPEDKIVKYQWQELPDNTGWQDVRPSEAQQPSANSSITFLPDKEGTFYYRCIVTLQDTEEASAQEIATASKPFEIKVGPDGATVQDPVKPWNGGSGSGSGSGNKDFTLLSGAPFTISNTEPYKIKGITAAKKGMGVTVQQVLSSFSVREADGARVQVVDRNGRVKAPTDIVCTGDKVELIGSNNRVRNTATIIVNGDVIGNGTMQLSQIVKMAKAMKDNSLTDEFFEAGDLDSNGSIGVTDLVIQAKELKNARQ